MSLLAQVQTGRDTTAPRILLYGTPGIGKTTWASQCPSPLILACEDGTANLEVDRLAIRDYKSLIEALTALASDDHKYITVVIDTIDALEPMIWADICANDPEGPESIDRACGGYMKGYRLATDRYWAEILRALTFLRSNRKMIVVLIAHSEVKKFESPTSESYDKFGLNLHKYAAPKIFGWCDIVAFADYSVMVKTTDAGFNKKKGQGIGQGKRELHLEERPGFSAKNRYSLPAKMEFDAKAFFALLQKSMNPAKPEEETKKNG